VDGQTAAAPELLDGERFVQVEAGHSTSGGLTSAGRVLVWGVNAARQCEVPPLRQCEQAIELTLGDRHSLVLTSAGRIVAWGSDDHGRCCVPALGPGESYLTDTGVFHEASVIVSVRGLDAAGRSFGTVACANLAGNELCVLQAEGLSVTKLRTEVARRLGVPRRLVYLVSEDSTGTAVVLTDDSTSD